MENQASLDIEVTEETELKSAQHLTRKEDKRQLVCHNCKKVLEAKTEVGEYCNESCRQAYINDVILFWKPDLVSESLDGEKPIDVIQYESRLAFMRLVRNADPDELTLRIKILKNVIFEAYEVALGAMEKDKLKAELEHEFITKEINKRHVAERDKLKVENAELKRQIDEVKKSGEKINPLVKQGAKAGKCMNCGKETLKETCSEKCKAEYKAIQGWMKIPGITEATARQMIKKLNTPESGSVN